ncbi:MAG: ribosomal L7Ae/L30e/S12e/Gadd45 family protein [Lachnospiraceae bacterium]|jgi:ribosomal protein L7Ae-like RNA K-turn-binding protein|nr:ribosomal L7Ae/L30e/S12e/Gadd45 family protein [Lachnospiraceae bacterium]
MHLAQNNKVTSLLGLATKAGKISSGEFMTEKTVKEGKAYLVMVADDASDNTKKKFKNMCEFYEVPICFFSEKESLGHAMGKELRASLAVVDEGFAKAIKKQLAQTTTE